MRILFTLFAIWLAASAVEGQTIRVHPSAQFMPLRVFDVTGKLAGGVVAEAAPLEPLAVTFLYLPPGARRGDTFTLKLQVELSEPNVGYRWAQLPKDRFLYDSTDCTGQSYVESNVSLPGRRLGLLDTQTNLLYLSQAHPTVIGKTFHSLRHPLQSCIATTENSLAVAVDPVVDTDDFFAPPFEIR